MAQWGMDATVCVYRTMFVSSLKVLVSCAVELVLKRLRSGRAVHNFGFGLEVQGLDLAVESFGLET